MAYLKTAAINACRTSSLIALAYLMAGSVYSANPVNSIIAKLKR